MHALRNDQDKYINYYGIWDINELYDLKSDPLESRNLIDDPKTSRSSTKCAEIFLQQ